MTDFERDLHDRLHRARLPDAPQTLIRAMDEIVLTPEPVRHRGSRPLALLMVAAVIGGSGILVASGAMDPEPTDDPAGADLVGSRPGDAGVLTHGEPHVIAPGRGRWAPRLHGVRAAVGSCGRKPRGRTDRARRLLVISRDRAQLRTTRRTAGRPRDLLPRRGVRHHRAERAGSGPDQGLPASARHGPHAHPMDPERGLGSSARISPARQRPALPAGPDRGRRPPRR